MIRFVLTVVVLLSLPLSVRAEVEIQEVTSDRGLTAWLVEDHAIPFVALEIRFRGGASLDAPGKRGAINLMTALLDDGAGDLDARGFARETEALATGFGFDVSDDALSVSARFLTENKAESMALLRAALLEPRFDPDAIERVRGQVLTGIRADAKDPDSIAARTFDRIAFGDHPYASSLNGTEESVAALTRDDLLAAHRAVLARDRIYISAVGDITPEQLSTLMDELLADLPAEGAPMPDRVEVAIPGGMTVVPFDTPQSVALFGQPGLAQDHPDYFTAIVLNQVLGGGGFESRLMSEVREKRGLTYGVYSYLAPKDFGEVYLGSVRSANDRIAEAIAVIREEWAKAAAEGITQEELDDAKTYMTGAYPLRFDGNGPIARIMVGMQMLGLPIDYIATRNERVEAVTLADVRRVAGDLLDPEGLHFVVVGQPLGLETTAGN
ncbi:M16 family metallopeptidase [Roseobacter sinensis]|uniref:Insulinase family protein n=1 Tax=Roseobacter sinensis TaxID=2931391 RepID=A0ABT3B9K8_9RHOB|nr:pitrilysin family protein [Roseobacter sp. WL0113]MCV3270261.1 insulinase family protein [Roseobacter sp. WL0113]